MKNVILLFISLFIFNNFIRAQEVAFLRMLDEKFDGNELKKYAQHRIEERKCMKFNYKFGTLEELGKLEYIEKYDTLINIIESLRYDENGILSSNDT